MLATRLEGRVKVPRRQRRLPTLGAGPEPVAVAAIAGRLGAPTGGRLVARRRRSARTPVRQLLRLLLRLRTLVPLWPMVCVCGALGMATAVGRRGVFGLPGVAVPGAEGVERLLGYGRGLVVI
jgi:hypothetical protein